jgi:hypothetical protein
VALSDSIKAEAATRRRPTCTVCLLITEVLGDEDRAALLEAMDGRTPHAVISRALGREGHRIGADTIGRHRNGMCLGPA